MRKLQLIFIPLVLLAYQSAFAAGSIESPDTVDDVGNYSSLALDVNGYPVVSYYDQDNEDLKVMHCNDVNCAGGDESIQTVDWTGNVGLFTSLALDINGYPVVSYYDYENDDLKVLHCNDAICFGWDESIETVDTFAAGIHSSLALGFDGFPVVSYWDASNEDLRILHCNDANCAGGDESIESVDTAGSVGQFTSLALDADGYPVVSYWDTDNNDLKVLHCNDPNCAGGDESIESVDTVDDVGLFTSLVLDDRGYPVVSYFDVANFDLKVLHCNDPNCAGGDESIESVDTVGDVGQTTSLALDASGYPVVSYYDHGNSALKLLHCNDENCAGGDERMVCADNNGDVGVSTSLALDTSGYPVVSYHDHGNEDLKVLHCLDALCLDANCASNEAPVPAANGPYEGLPNIGIELSSAGSIDPENLPFSHGWAVTSANSEKCSFDDETLASPELTCTEADEYEVTLTTTDAGDLSGEDKALVKIITQRAGIDKLSAELDELVDDGILKKGQARGLRNPLRNSARSLDKNKTAAACNQLQDFIDEATAKNPTPLKAELAAHLIGEAKALQHSIGCGT